jgi:spermidine synthase
MLAFVARPGFGTTGSLPRRLLGGHTDSIDALPDAHIGWWIALAAGLGLYIELMVIRVHSSYFQVFAYLKNVSLLSCFLGLGIGYARGSKWPLATPLVLPLLTVQIMFLYLLRSLRMTQLLQNPIPEMISFGLRSVDKISYTLIVYGFLILVFAFNALCFVPLGQLASRLMLRRKTLVAYSWNLVGSLAGILLFSFVSFLWTPPAAWILLAAAGLVPFLGRRAASMWPSAAAVVVLLVLMSIPTPLNKLDVFSPYQILTVEFSRSRLPVIQTANSYYQRILDLSVESTDRDERLREWSAYYELPYRFRPDPERVLVVGSGTGNDVAAAIRAGAGEIDAVEIDPAIVHLGRRLHPERPYQSPKVRTIVNDARAFLRTTERRYDLIVYGLLDSHSLLSSKAGGIRLDSYVYTVEGFREARKRLEPGGMISLTFSLVRPEIGRKLYLMLREAFDDQPPLAYQAGYDAGHVFLAGDDLETESLSVPPALTNVTGDFADERIRADPSTDDWPFFYMPVRKYPASYVVMMLILLGVSVLYVARLVAAPGGRSFSSPCFFLGAGFMLVETKAITELALVYGSTWIVISAVIGAILIMAFSANWLVMKRGHPPPPITYGLLLASLMLGLGLTFVNTAGLGAWSSRLTMTAALTLPLFFSGFAFSTELKRSGSVAVALSSNLLGAMLGGFLEYNAMYFGFRSLYLLAMAMYGLAFWGSLRTVHPRESSGGCASDGGRFR